MSKGLLHNGWVAARLDQALASPPMGQRRCPIGRPAASRGGFLIAVRPGWRGFPGWLARVMDVKFTDVPGLHHRAVHGTAHLIRGSFSVYFLLAS